MADICRMKRDRSRERRRKRRDMIHAAGCVYENCPVRRSFLDDKRFVQHAQWLGIRIPRSLRRHWGLDG